MAIFSAGDQTPSEAERGERKEARGSVVTASSYPGLGNLKESRDIKEDPANTVHTLVSLNCKSDNHQAELSEAQADCTYI